MTRRPSGRRETIAAIRIGVWSVVAFGLLALALLASLPPAWAADQLETTTSAEAWYTLPQAAPACDLTPLCTPDADDGPTPGSPPVLYVGVAVGMDTDRTFLTFDLSGVPVGAEVVGGQLILPLEGPPAGDSQAEDTAMVACTVHAAIKPATGTLGQGPPYDCTSSAPVRYLAASGDNTDLFGYLIVDLEPLAVRWAGLTSASLAIVPSVDAHQDGQSWRFAVRGRQDADAASPIRAVLSVEAADSDEPHPPSPAPPPSEQPPATTEHGNLGASPQIQTPVDVHPDLGSEPVDPPLVSSPADPPPQAPIALGETLQLEFAYPGVFWLPLGLLTVASLFARTLLADIPRMSGDPANSSEVHP